MSLPAVRSVGSLITRCHDGVTNLNSAVPVARRRRRRRRVARRQAGARQPRRWRPFLSSDTPAHVPPPPPDKALAFRRQLRLSAAPPWLCFHPTRGSCVKRTRRSLARSPAQAAASTRRGQASPCDNGRTTHLSRSIVLVHPSTHTRITTHTDTRARAHTTTTQRSSSITVTRVRPRSSARTKTLTTVCPATCCLHRRK